jgi:hypothetical protein
LEAKRQALDNVGTGNVEKVVPEQTDKQPDGTDATAKGILTIERKRRILQLVTGIFELLDPATSRQEQKLKNISLLLQATR